MRRKKPLKQNIDTLIAWRDRSQRTAMAGAMRRPRKRGSDGPWRLACLEKRGPQCRVTGCVRMTDVEMDHMIAKAHLKNPSVIENGLPLCRMHHQMKTDHLLLIDPAWLGEDQIQWLADQGHAVWRPEDGVVTGRHCRIFADRSLL